ncbi:MAG: PQQ-binding-like beta-propeller repeat protein [Planctomycetota bacterium]
MRRFLLVATLGALLSSTGQLAAALNNEILTEAVAQRYGLTRAWITQAQVNHSQGRLQTVVFCDGVLYAQSSRATLEAIDAETGQKLWSKMIGQPNHPCLPPSAYRDLVATINGSTLYVMNRYTGDILYQTTINGAPCGGPALSSKRAYVPIVSGMILAYRLEPITDAAKELGKINPNAAEMSEDEKKEAAKKAEEERRENIRIRQGYIPPLACNSTGRALVPPVVTAQNLDEEFVTWGTDRGYLYVGRIDRRSEDTFTATYRLGTNGTFSSPPAYLPRDPKVLGDSGVIYAGSSDGYVYAVLERGGELQWKFPTSDPVVDSPVVIEDRVYATTELGGMFCIDAKSGKQIWFAPDLLHFVAAGKQRVYAADKVGCLRILDARNGTTLDTLPTSTLPIMISNGKTDRIYLATEGGTIQCLREVEQTNPVVHNESRKPPPDDDQPKVPQKPKPKSGDSGAPKVAHDRVAPKKPAVKKEKEDAGSEFGDADTGLDKPEKPAKPAKPEKRAKPEKPAKVKAGGAKAKAGAKAKKGADADADAGN